MSDHIAIFEALPVICKSFVQKLSFPKNSRWLAWNECAEQYLPEFYASRMLLEWYLDSADGIKDPDVDPLASLREGAQSMGGLRLAYACMSQQTFEDVSILRHCMKPCLVMVHSSSWKCQVATGQCCLHWAYGQQLEIWISLETDWIPPCLWQPEIIWKISWLLHGCRPHGKPCLQVCEHFPSWTVFFIPSSCLPPWHMDWVAERWPDCGRSSHWHCEAGLLQFVVMWEELGTMFSRACIWFEIVVHCTMSLDLFPAGNVRMVKGRRWDVQWSCFNHENDLWIFSRLKAYRGYSQNSQRSAKQAKQQEDEGRKCPISLSRELCDSGKGHEPFSSSWQSDFCVKVQVHFHSGLCSEIHFQVISSQVASWVWENHVEEDVVNTITGYTGSFKCCLGVADCISSGWSERIGDSYSGSFTKNALLTCL